jgi:hypothetical protein
MESWTNQHFTFLKWLWKWKYKQILTSLTIFIIHNSNAQRKNKKLQGVKCTGLATLHITFVLNLTLQAGSSIVLMPENLSQWRQPVYVLAVSRLREKSSLLYHLLDYFQTTWTTGTWNTVVPLASSYSSISTTTPRVLSLFTIKKLEMQ